MHDRKHIYYSTNPSIFTHDQFKEVDKKIFETEQRNLERLDANWDSDKNLKENIFHIFKGNLFPHLKIKSTGFYSDKNSKLIADQAEEKSKILDVLSKDKLTLEDCYSSLYFLQLHHNEIKSQEIKIKIPYVIKRMEDEEPELKKLRSEVELGSGFKLNF